MIIFLYGQDSYRSKRKLEEIIESYKKVHKSGLNLIYFDVKESDFKDLCNNFKVVSMFDEKKLIVIKNVFSVKTFQEDLLKEVKNLKEAKDIVVVYEKDSIDPVRGQGVLVKTRKKQTSNGVDEKNNLFKALKKEAKCQEFSLLDDKLLKVWLRKEFEKYGAKIDSLAENLLLTYVGNNLWQMENEVKKLVYFKRGSLIKKEDIELQVKPKIEVDIFKTIDALASKDKKQALNFLYKHLESGDNPLYILSMIGYQFRTLLTIKELMEKKYPYAAIAQKSGLHPFVVRKSYYLCRQFTMAQLKKIYQKIFQVDLDIKTGKIEAETALNLLVSEV